MVATRRTSIACFWMVIVGVLASAAIGCIPKDDPGIPDSGEVVPGADSGAPFLSLDAIAHEFGSVVSGATSMPVQVTVTNSGSAPSGAVAVAISGPDAADFGVASDGCSGQPIAVGASCVFTMSFHPTTAGPKSAAFAVSATPGGTATTSASGTALAKGALAISPTSHDFGAVPVGTATADSTFTITNTGGAPTGALAAHFSGANAALFTLTSDACTGMMLAPAASCVVHARFAPDAIGAKSASLDVTGSPGGTTASSLGGTAIAPGALVITPSPRDFGSVVVGASSADVTFTVTNSGAAATGVPAIALAGGDAAHFAIASTGCTAALAGGATCDVKVHFTPTTAGAKNALLGAAATPGGMATATLTATGLAPAVLAIAPTPQDFGTVVLGSSSADVAFTVTNSGGVASGVPSVSLGGANASELAITTNGCTAAVAPGASCTVKVRFTPTGAGAKSATLDVSASPGGAASATLSGNALTPGQLSISPPSAGFGSLLIGNVSASTSFTVTNSGGAATGVPVVSITGTDASQFEIVTNGCTAAIPGGGTCSISARFHPSVTGAKSAGLTVTASPGGAASAGLSGTGLGPAQLTIGPSNQGYGTLVVGAVSGDTTFTVTNTGGVASGAPVVSIGGADAGQFGISSNGCTTPLGAGATCSVLVHFAPTTPGGKNALLGVSASPGGNASATLSGTALAQAQLTISPPSNAYGTIVVGASSGAATFTITNAGGVASGVPTVSLGGANPGDFAVSSNGCTAAIGAGSSCTVQVKFAPASAGAKNASVSIASAPGGTATATLSGTAVTPGTLSISPASNAYASTVTGSSTAPFVFTVTNTGGAATGTVTISLGGTDASQFAIGANGCSGNPLAPAASCTVGVAFAPTLTGGKSATLTASGNPGGTTSATLTGTGLAPALLTIAPTPQDFGVAATGTSTSPITFTVKNTGGVASGNVALALGGTNASEFGIASGTCMGALGAGLTCSVAIKFAPTTTGMKTATLTASGMPGGSAVATLTGTGAVPAILVLRPASKAFGSTIVGIATAATTFTVLNNGGTSSGSLGLSFTGTDPGDFKITATTCMGSLPGGGNCTIDVVFLPQKASPVGNLLSASLTVTGAPGGTTTSSLTGDGTSILTANPSSSYLGRAPIGQTGQTSRFSIQNPNMFQSTGPLTVTLGGADPTNFKIVSDPCTNVSLGPGGNCVIQVQLTPLAPAGAKSATVTVGGIPGGSTTITVTGDAL